jgi:TRAP-type mannitol/chloroaromatic compound transport system substrate-binding protein
MDMVAFQYAPDGPEALGWFKEPVKTVEEFKKLRFRSPPGLPGEVYSEMGAKPVSMAGAEIIPAAERGVIDAGEWINPATDLKMGFYDVFKYYCLQGLHQAIGIADIMVNGEKWRELPPDLQAILRVAAKASVLEALTYFIAQNSEALTILQKEHGVTLFDAPEGYAPEFVAAAKRVLAKYEAEYPFFKKVMDSQRAFAKDAVPYRVQTLKQALILGEAALKK